VKVRQQEKERRNIDEQAPEKFIARRRQATAPRPDENGAAHQQEEGRVPHAAAGTPRICFRASGLIARFVQGAS
jgi:hypothetical protein